MAMDQPVQVTKSINSVSQDFLTISAIERPGLESQRSRKRLFFTERFSNSLKLNFSTIMNFFISKFSI